MFNNQRSPVDSVVSLRVCENRYVELRAMADGALLRTATYQDREHIVVPIVTAVGDQVWWPANAPTPELVPASVLQAAAQSRNNRPVVMGHPKVSGSYVSANSPEILEQYCFGYMFASTFDNDNRRIKVEAWLDPAMAERVGPAAVNVIERLKNGEKIEVSEGNYVVTIEEAGKFNGKEYGSRWISAESDHLAALDVTQTGACSNEMGCGNLVAGMKAGQTDYSRLRISELRDELLSVAALSQARRPTFTGTETIAWSRPSFADYVKYLDNSDTPPTSVGQCSSALKAKIAAHTLIGDPDATTFAALSALPVVNPATDKLNERALRAVLAGRGVSGLTDTALASAQEIARRLLNSEFSANLSTSTNGAKMKNKNNLLTRILASIKSAVSNNDLRWNLYKALSDIRPGVAFVDDEDTTTKIVRYCVIVRYGSEWEYNSDETEYHYFQRGFEVDESGNVTLDDNEVEVEFQETWKPISESATTTDEPALEAATSATSTCGCHKNDIDKGDTDMKATEKQKQLAGQLIASSKAPFDESDRATLEAMNEDKLQKLADGFAEPTAVPANDPSPVAAPEAPVVSSAASTASGASVTPPGHRTLTEDEYRSLKSAADAHAASEAQRRTFLVSTLKTAQNGFTEADLTAMDMSGLEKLAVAFKIDQPATVDYSVRGVNRPTASNVSERALPDTWGINAKSN